MAESVVVRPEPGDLIGDWNRLAHGAGSPFLTYEWLSCWWAAFGRGEPTWLLLRAEDGSLAAGASLQRAGSELSSAANVHSGDWDAVARDDSARAELWKAMGGLAANCVKLVGIPEREGSADAAAAALGDAGYRIVLEQRPSSPWVELPATWDELIHRVSRNLRSQWRRRRRALEREGKVAFRTISDPEEVDSALDAFLELEAAGWKGRSGTAIVSHARTERLYRSFAEAAAKQGWLRLHLLELDDELIAADYTCFFSASGFLMKTAFSEAHERLSPGLVLRGEALQAAIHEGLRSYDFLGGPDRYKLSWASQLRPRARVLAYRGAALPRYAYRSRLHPVLRSRLGPIATRVRARARRLSASRTDRGPRRPT